MGQKTKTELRAMLLREKNPKVAVIITGKIKALEASEAAAAQLKIEAKARDSEQYQRLVSATALSSGVEYFKDLATVQYLVPSETGDTQFSHSELAEVRQMGLSHLHTLKLFKDLFHAKKVDTSFEPQPERMRWEG